VAPGSSIRVLLCDDHAIVREGLGRLARPHRGHRGRRQRRGRRRGGRRGGRGAAGRRAHGPRDAERRRDRRDPPHRRRGAGANVVVLTSFGDNTRIHDALDAGALGYLLKDADAAEVVRAIRAASRGEAPLDPRVARAVLARGTTPAALSAMTTREREVLALLGTGLPNKVIARRLGISEATVKAHLTRIFRQIGVTDRTQAAIWAREHRVVVE
jgi:DNA-binding CsgD family transcriptional regulator